MRVLVGCIAVLLLSHCGTGRPRTVAVLPLSNQPRCEALDEAHNRVRFNGTTLDPIGIREKIPKGVRSLDTKSASQTLLDLAAGASVFFEKDAKVGQGQMLEAWKRLEPHPEWLPGQPEQRKEVYETLLTLYRVWTRTDADGAGRLLLWLATHLPEQQPSVKFLPPQMEYEVTQFAQETTTPRHELSVESPKDAGACQLFVDGLPLGTLPLSTRILPEGTHALWVQCEKGSSWVVDMDLNSNIHLETQGVPLQRQTRVKRDCVLVDPTLNPRELEKLGRHFLSWLEVDGVVWVPVDDPKAPALLTTRGNITHLPPEEGRYSLKSEWVLDRKDDWQTIGWVTLGAAAVLAGAGVGLNLHYNGLVNEMNTGVADHRNEFDNIKAATITMYASAAAMLVATGVFWVLSLAEGGDSVPLFDNALKSTMDGKTNR